MNYHANFKNYKKRPLFVIYILYNILFYYINILEKNYIN